MHIKNDQELTLRSAIKAFGKKFRTLSTKCQAGKNKAMLSRFLAEQTKWKRLIREKQARFLEKKGKIKSHEVKLSILLAVFIVMMAFSLVTLLILTPLSVMGLAFHVPRLIWGLGLGEVVFGVIVGFAAISSALALHAEKEELDQIVKEKKHFKSLMKQRGVMGHFFNFDQLSHWGLIELSREEHQQLLKEEFWKHPLFVELMEELENVVHYEKNHLAIPLEMQVHMRQLLSRLERAFAEKKITS